MTVAELFENGTETVNCIQIYKSLHLWSFLCSVCVDIFWCFEIALKDTSDSQSLFSLTVTCYASAVYLMQTYEIELYISYLMKEVCFYCGLKLYDINRTQRLTLWFNMIMNKIYVEGKKVMPAFVDKKSFYEIQYLFTDYVIYDGLISYFCI